MTQPPATAQNPRLDGPPPSPAMGAGGGPSGVLPPGGAQAMAGLVPEQESGGDRALKGIAQVLQSVDRILLSVIQALPAGAQEFSQARQLIENGLAKALAGSSPSSPVSSTPTEPGTQFPGGGFANLGPLR